PFLVVPASTLFPYTTLFRSCEELHKLLTGVAGGGLAEHFAGLRIQCRIQRQRAMTVVFKPVTLGAARRKRQYRIEPVERLNRRLDRKSTRLNSSHGSISYAV